MAELLLVEGAEKALYFLTKDCGFLYHERVAKGGYGVVYKLYNQRKDKLRAVKVCISPGYFEVLDWPHFKHENVVPLLDMLIMDKDSNCIVFIMPMLRTDLMEICRGTTFYKDKLSYDICRIWFQDILRGMSYIHGVGLCHLDLKMNNTFLMNNGHACVGDFSLMCDSDHVPWSIPFKSHFRPPEFTTHFEDLAKRERETEFAKGVPADMWQLGILLLDMLMAQKVLIKYNSNDTDFRFDVLAFIEKVLDDNKKYLTHCLKKKFTTRFFDQMDLACCSNILKRFLQILPENRLTAEEALNHPFLPDIEWPNLQQERLYPVDAKDATVFLLDATYKLPRPDGAIDQRRQIGALIEPGSPAKKAQDLDGAGNAQRPRFAGAGGHSTRPPVTSRGKNIQKPVGGKNIQKPVGGKNIQKPVGGKNMQLLAVPGGSKKSKSPVAGGSRKSSKSPIAGGSKNLPKSSVAGGSRNLPKSPVAGGSGYRPKPPVAGGGSRNLPKSPVAGGSGYRPKPPVAGGGSRNLPKSPVAGGSGYRPKPPVARRAGIPRFRVRVKGP